MKRFLSSHIIEAKAALNTCMIYVFDYCLVEIGRISIESYDLFEF